MLTERTLTSLLTASLPVFELVLLQAPAASLTTLRPLLIMAIEQMQLGMTDFPNEIRAGIQYAIVAWIDDQLQNAAWEGQAQWHQHNLQLHYYHENTAGDQFYTRLDQARLQGPSSAPVIFMHLVCLELGFLGQLRLRSTPCNNEIKHACQNYLRDWLPNIGLTHPMAESPPMPWYQKTRAHYGVIAILFLGFSFSLTLLHTLWIFRVTSHLH